MMTKLSLTAVLALAGAAGANPIWLGTATGNSFSQQWSSPAGPVSFDPLIALELVAQSPAPTGFEIHLPLIANGWNVTVGNGQGGQGDGSTSSAVFVASGEGDGAASVWHLIESAAQGGLGNSASGAPSVHNFVSPQGGNPMDIPIPLPQGTLLAGIGMAGLFGLSVVRRRRA